MEALQAKRDREEEVLAMARLEDWAATRIQALVRGETGRAKAKARRLEHKARWRELFDEDRGTVFYYNKVMMSTSPHTPFRRFLPRKLDTTPPYDHTA